MCWFRMDRFVSIPVSTAATQLTLFRAGKTICTLDLSHGNEYLILYGVAGLVFDSVSHFSDLIRRLTM
jgi:hypothetical protein